MAQDTWMRIAWWRYTNSPDQRQASVATSRPMTTPPGLSAAVIESGRVVLRKAGDTDREGIVEVLTDPGMRAYLGGPRRREDVEKFLDQAGPAAATAAAGSYVIADRQADGSSAFWSSAAARPTVPDISPARAGNWNCPMCCGATPG
jgi:hypothetical protein